VIDRKRSGYALQSEKARPAADSASLDPGTLWLIALPALACNVALGSYLVTMIASRLF
jgi:hypothetical protein